MAHGAKQFKLAIWSEVGNLAAENACEFSVGIFAWVTIPERSLLLADGKCHGDRCCAER